MTDGEEGERQARDLATQLDRACVTELLPGQHQNVCQRPAEPDDCPDRQEPGGHQHERRPNRNYAP